MSPLVVVGVVAAGSARMPDIVRSPEWSFGAAVIAMQALVRFVVGVGRLQGTSPERVAVGIVALLVFVVAPSFILLSLVLLQADEPGISRALALSQVIFFGLVSLLFVLVATTANLALTATPSE
jgi:hypothetical protein